MSTRKTKSESETPTPAPRKRKTAAADLSTPKPTRSRRTVTTAPAISEATDTSVASTELSHEAIATRAYFIAIERGGPGDPVADWLLAEQELRGL
jgi:Protein of unknown function (DUF2934)